MKKKENENVVKLNSVVTDSKKTGIEEDSLPKVFMESLKNRVEATFPQNPSAQKAVADLMLREMKKSETARKQKVTDCASNASKTVSKFMQPLGEFLQIPSKDNALTFVESDSADFNAYTVEDGACDSIREQIQRVNNGDLREQEGILVANAISLDSMFHKLARRAEALLQQGGDLKHYETLMRLALKSQNQVRSTLETLSKLKNPPQVSFIRQQQNNSAINQQINNEALPVERLARTEEKQEIDKTN